MLPGKVDMLTGHLSPHMAQGSFSIEVTASTVLRTRYCMA